MEDPAFYKEVRTEFVKADSRALRWEEELLIVPEEMRRSCQFLVWNADRWLSRIGLLSASPDIEEGLTAYAKRQSDIHRGLACAFARKWAPRLRAAKISADWLSAYDIQPVPSFVTPDTRVAFSASDANVDIVDPTASTTLTPARNISDNWRSEAINNSPIKVLDASYDAYGFRSKPHTSIDDDQGDWSDEADISDAESIIGGDASGLGEADAVDEWEAPTGEWMMD